MKDQYVSAEGMRKWAQIKRLEDERHVLEKKIIELTRHLQEVEDKIHKLGGM